MASIKFDTTEILDTTHVPRFVKHETAPDRQIISQPLAREDGQVFIYERYDKKVINLQGVLIGTSQADLDAKIDTFKELFSRPQKQLDISWGAGTRRYIASCSAHTFDRDYYNTSMVPWTAQFTVLTGEGKDTSITTPSGADGSTGTRLSSDPSATPTYGVANVTIVGSKPPKPVITFSNVSRGGAAGGFEYKNVTTGDVLQVTDPGNWGASRTIVIDCDAKTVTGDIVTGVMHPLTFYGTFPRFAVGANVINSQFGGIVNQKSADNSVSDLIGSQIVINDVSYRKAQSFMVPYTDSTFCGVSIAVYQSGSPGTLRWEIQTDSGGAPSGTLVDATNSKGTFSSVGTTIAYQYAEPTSAAPFTLNANTVYWMVIKADSTLNGSNEYFLGLAGDGVSGNSSYARGRARYSTDNGGTYQDYTLKTDMSFRIHYGNRRATMLWNHEIDYYQTFL